MDAIKQFEIEVGGHDPQPVGDHLAERRRGPAEHLHRIAQGGVQRPVGVSRGSKLRGERRECRRAVLRINLIADIPHIRCHRLHLVAPADRHIGRRGMALCQNRRVNRPGQHQRPHRPVQPDALIDQRDDGGHGSFGQHVVEGSPVVVLNGGPIHPGQFLIDPQEPVVRADERDTDGARQPPFL